jgi:hypothetical protein
LGQQQKSQKICVCAIDAAASWVNLSVPQDAGPDVIGVVLVHFGTANWLNFVPTTINGNPPGRASCDSKVGGEIEFFLPKKMREAAGSLTSTYRVVRKRKYNFKS